MSAQWLNSIARTPRGVPTFEDATVVAAAVATAAASIIAAPGLGGVAGAGLACLMVAIAVVDARRFIIPDEFSAAALALGLVDAAIPTRMTRSTPRPSSSTGFGQPSQERSTVPDDPAESERLRWRLADRGPRLQERARFPRL